jgi:8-oxo-dGTP pyrophosphatase MutT (NUDIX family)
MYKVFIKDSLLQLQRNAQPNAITYLSKTQLSTIIDELESGASKELVLHCYDLEQAWQDLLSLSTLVEAAGGLVRSGSNNILVIKRLGCWDLPKGKIESGEAVEKAAQREVMEECGVPEPELLRPIIETYHTYRIEGELILKRTYWFDMKLEGEPKLTAQAEEDISEARWLAPDHLDLVLSNTYENIRLVVKQAQKLNLP